MGNEENGHSIIDSLITENNIKNQIDKSTINSIMQASHGNLSARLYEAFTKGGDKRYIERLMPSIGTKENFRLMDDLLRLQIKHQPDFSDTVRVEDLPQVKKNISQLGAPDIFDRLINKIVSLFGK